MLSWFEKRIDPFPAEAPEQPPTTLFAFCWHYTKGIWPWLAITSVLIAAISALQVALFGSFLPLVLLFLKTGLLSFKTIVRQLLG